MEDQMASTSSNYSESKVDVSEGGGSIDYGDDSIAALLNETITVVNNDIENNNATRIEGFNFFRGAEWITWLVFAVGLIVIIGTLTGIITYIVWNKKRVIRTTNNSDQFYIGTYDNYTCASCTRWLCCCRRSDCERRENLKMMRQNSASNLDPYKRPPLPPINSSQNNGDGYQTTHIVPQRLEPLHTKTDESKSRNYQTKCSVIEDDIDGDYDDDLYGIQIKAIKGIPVIQLCKEEKRTLPKPPFFDRK